MGSNVIMMVGIPASGKSTYIINKMNTLTGVTAVRISRDDIRKTLVGNGEYFSKEKEVFNEFIRQINHAITNNVDYIFVDATHINKASRAKLLRKLRPAHDTTLCIKVIQTSLEDCLERNSKREGFARVPDSAIVNMYHSFEIPKYEELSYVADKFTTITIEM